MARKDIPLRDGTLWLWEDFLTETAGLQAALAAAFRKFDAEDRGWIDGEDFAAAWKLIQEFSADKTE